MMDSLSKVVALKRQLKVVNMEDEHSERESTLVFVNQIMVVKGDHTHRLYSDNCDHGSKL